MGCEQRMVVNAAHTQTTLFAGIFLYHVYESASLITLVVLNAFPCARTGLKHAANWLDQQVTPNPLETHLKPLNTP